MGPTFDFEEKKRRISGQFRAATGGVRLRKQTSNLFRDRDPNPRSTLDVSEFNQVIQVDANGGWVEVEGMTAYRDLVDATLEAGVMPSVVPQLKSITVGGAVAGVGIESTSFRHGLVHEGVINMEILTGNGDVVLCSRDNEHQDLFWGFANSYGTLGYALKLKIRTIPVAEYVKLEHVRYDDADSYFRDLQHWATKEVDFLDGTAFSPTELYVTAGVFTKDAPFVSDYTYEHIFYRSIRDKKTDFLTASDYLWRWDTDWFWCSKNLFAQHPIIRRLYGRRRLNSVFYTKIMRWNAKWRPVKTVERLLGIHSEAVIQDVDIPIQHAAEFLEFFDAEIGIRPVWICPFKSPCAQNRFPLYPTDPETLYVNFGFWDSVRGRTSFPRGHYNKKIENKVKALGGVKSLYSDSFYDRDTFWELYNEKAYHDLKRKYDSTGRLKNLYDKCVLRQ